VWWTARFRDTRGTDPRQPGTVLVAAGRITGPTKPLVCKLRSLPALRQEGTNAMTWILWIGALLVDVRAPWYRADPFSPAASGCSPHCHSWSF
jgi:hypothetical protein